MDCPKRTVARARYKIFAALLMAVALCSVMACAAEDAKAAAAGGYTRPRETTQWMQVGPDGGDARTLAYDPADPSHLFLGTSAGQLYSSRDSGRTWSLL